MSDLKTPDQETEKESEKEKESKLPSSLASLTNSGTTTTNADKIDGKLKVPLTSIQLRAEDLYDTDKVELDAVSMDQCLALLQCDAKGLNSSEVTRRLEIFGPNKLPTLDSNPFLQFLSFMWNPLSWVMEGAALVAIALSNGGGRAPDWEDFVGIVGLLLVNSAIGFYEENKASKAVRKLMESLTPKAKVKRDGTWSILPSGDLVPGDIVSFKMGDIIPADVRLTEAINTTIDQSGLTGESLPVRKKEGDQVYSNSTSVSGESEGIVIATGPNTFYGCAAALVAKEKGSASGHLQHVLAQIGLFCICSIALFVVLEIIILYGAPGFRYDYRRGLDNILVLLIGGIPIAMPVVLSVTLAIGAKELAKHKAIVTRIPAIEELAGVTILCSDKTGTLTTNKLTIDKETTKTYTDTYSADDVLKYAAFASRTENQDHIDKCVVNSYGLEKSRQNITLLDFMPFDPVHKRTEITYSQQGSDTLKRASKGMSTVIHELCAKSMSTELGHRLEADVAEFAARGLRSLAVAIENDIPANDKSAPGSGFQLIGLLAIFDPPRADSEKTIRRAVEMGVAVKMITGDQLAIAKETGRRLGLGDHMWPASVFTDGPPVDSKYANMEELIMDANGFAGVFPKHKLDIVQRIKGLGHLVAMTGDGANDAPALSVANVGIAVEGSTDAARGSAAIVLTEPGLSTIIDAIIHSRMIFQRMRNYAIYACSVTIRIVVGFALMAFIWQFDFPPFMVLIIALTNDGTILTLSVDRVKPSATPDAWNLPEIFIYAICYGLYLALSTIIFFLVIVSSTFFEDKFGVDGYKDHNNYHLHMIIYLQVAIISQALIFVTRSHGFSFTERPSTLLLAAFCVAQGFASILAAFVDMSWTKVHSISGGWIGIVWVWNIVWYMGLDPLKFFVRWSLINPYKAYKLKKEKEDRIAGVPLVRTQSRVASIHESFYSNRLTFLDRATRAIGFHRHIAETPVHIAPTEMQRFNSIQANRSGDALARHPSRT